MHYIHKVGCTSVRQVPVTGTCSFRLTTQIWRDLCLSETQIHKSSDLWVSHGYTCVDPQVTQTRAQPYMVATPHKESLNLKIQAVQSLPMLRQNGRTLCTKVESGNSTITTTT